MKAQVWGSGYSYETRLSELLGMSGVTASHRLKEFVYFYIKSTVYKPPSAAFPEGTPTFPCRRISWAPRPALWPRCRQHCVCAR